MYDSIWERDCIFSYVSDENASFFYDSSGFDYNRMKNECSSFKPERKENFDNSDLDSNSNLYYFKNQSKTKNKKTSEVTTTENKKIFKINKVNKEKRAGRKRKRKGDHQNNEKVHTNKEKDNILRKIQVHFIKFLIALINEILINLGIKEQFSDINYAYKKDITKKNFENMKTKEIGEILCQDLNGKYKKDKKNNKKVYSEVIKNEIIKKILSEKYINIFINLYYKNQRDLNDYDINIQFSDKINTYQDLLEKNSDDSEYIYQIKDKVQKCYLSQYKMKFISH